MPKKNRKIMDSVFKDLFGEDRDCKKKEQFKMRRDKKA